MTRLIDADDLVTNGEVAWRLHVNPAAVSNYLTRHTDFPKPVFVHVHTKLFLWSEVREWARARGMKNSEGVRMNPELTRELYQLLAYAVRRLGRTTIDNLKAQREILKIAELMTGPLVGALGLELVDPEGTEKLLADIRNVLSKLEERRGR